MSYIGSWKIDDLLTFVVVTQVFATGVATDADAVPAYRVYEDETGTPILTGNMALLDSANTAGLYSEQITLSAANGFEKGKCYTIHIAATVSSVAGATTRTFQMQAEVAVASINAAAITAASIASDAITDAKVASDVTIASVTGAVGSVTGNVGGSVASVTALAANSVNASALATDAVTEIANGIFDQTDAVETGLTFRQALRLALAALAGKLSGGGTTTNTFRNSVADSKNRIVATVDTSGNRSAITTDLT